MKKLKPELRNREEETSSKFFRSESMQKKLALALGVSSLSVLGITGCVSEENPAAPEPEQNVENEGRQLEEFGVKTSSSSTKIPSTTPSSSSETNIYSEMTGGASSAAHVEPQPVDTVEQDIELAGDVVYVPPVETDTLTPTPGSLANVPSSSSFSSSSFDVNVAGGMVYVQPSSSSEQQVSISSADDPNSTGTDSVEIEPPDTLQVEPLPPTAGIVAQPMPVETDPDSDTSN